MLLPDKHIRISESLIGLGSFVIEALKSPKTIDELWTDFQKVNNTNEFPAYHSFENLVLSIIFLFSTGVIDEDSRGRIFKCD